jgi:hypothetical protein
VPATCVFSRKVGCKPPYTVFALICLFLCTNSKTAQFNADKKSLTRSGRKFLINRYLEVAKSFKGKLYIKEKRNKAPIAQAAPLKI